MKVIKDSYREFFTKRDFLKSLFIAIIFLTVALFINYYAGLYATERASNPVTDIILSNIRVYNVDVIFIYGPIIFWFFVAFIAFSRPNLLPFTIKCIALFVIIRSGFISLTHIGPFPTHVFISPTNILRDFTLGNDLFFSAHTGLPFLMALVFWKNKYLRYFFIASAILFGVIVLLGHLHYSIDVASAFFITYTIHHICTKIFKKDLDYFSNNQLEPQL